MLRLVCGNLNYSSWSMRPWLALKHAQLPFKTFDVGLRTADGWKDKILSFSGAGKVPVLVDGSLSVHESLAICEYVAELAPAAKLWPEDPHLRARGRAIACEMHSGFSALRQSLTTNLRARAPGRAHQAEVAADIARVLDIFRASLSTAKGRFLLGEFSIADCMFFPVVTRFRTYGVPLPEDAAAYSAALFELPFVQELEALAEVAPAIPEYDAALRVSG
ncbi:MAG: glutathione S-transferase family protein [Myxococcales bacterium]|nr:MAG: glutathione S-transferase family protein [Myxococcales bacterium]